MEIVLGAIAAIGHAPNSTIGGISCPGSFDPEVELISSAMTRRPGEQVPSWEDVSECLRLAREWLTVTSLRDSFADPRSNSAEEVIRRRARAEWCSVRGATYPSVANEIASHLLTKLPERATRTLTERAPAFEALLACHRELALYHLEGLATVRRCATADQAVDYMVNKYTPHDAASLLAARGEYPSDYASVVEILTWQCTEIEVTNRNDTPLLGRPFVTIDGKATLILPRRLLSDFFDLFDRYLLSACVSNGEKSGSAYTKCRAAVLDSLVAHTLSRILPNASIGVNIRLKGQSQAEKDIVCYYEDIALAIETKGAPYKSSALRGSPALIEHLQRNVGKAAEQACESAAAIASLTPMEFESTTEEFPSPNHAPRAIYPWVVTGHGPSCIDSSSNELRAMNILPEDADVLVSSVDRFFIFVKLFCEPDLFIAYLDFRRSLDRRPWVQYVDEFEAIGFFLTQTTSKWLTKRHGEQLTLKGTFQEHLREIVSSAEIGFFGDVPLHQMKCVPIVNDFITELRTQRPSGWLQAASAALRTPLDCQLWLADQLRSARAILGKSRRRYLTNPENTIGLAIFANEPDLAHTDDIRWLRRLQPPTAMSWTIALGALGACRVLGIRGVDDCSPWGISTDHNETRGHG